MEIIAIALLAVIAVAEVHRTVWGLMPTSKKGFFKAKLKQTRQTIWDLEFKIFKTREIREEIRQQYDQMLSRIDNLKGQIANWPADADPAEKARIADQQALAERDAERFVRQMQMLDAEVDGLKPTVDHPNGQIGISEQVDSVREVSSMITDYVKTL